MYASSFGLTEAPFSISPDPRYLYMSQRHQEAMAHLRYGIQESGGFIQLTGEVGTGKTTICRYMLEQLPENIDVALILNPQISHNELLAALCDEIGVSYPEDATPKQLLDRLNEHLIETFSRGRRTVLVIDEAQMLTREVLEQIRVLTNLETTRQKLLQIILIGQPELSTLLARQDLRQLAQRITARYHLRPLTREETAQYIKYRLGVAGCHRSLFSRWALRRVYRHSRGVPRLINVICDRAMLGAYSQDSDRVTAAMVSRAAREVLGGEPPRRRWWWISGLAVASAAVVLAAVLRPQWLGMDFQSPGAATSPPAEAPLTGSAGDPALPAVEPATENRALSALEPAVGNQVLSAVEPAADAPAATPAATAYPDTAAAQADLSLESLLKGSDAPRDESGALGRLLAAWRVDVIDPGGLSCSMMEGAHGLRCLQGRGGWDDLVSFNRVAALALEHEGGTSYLLLTGLDAGRVTLAGRDGVYSFERQNVDEHWDGEYLLLWRPPPQGAETIAEHSEGVDVLWLRQTLSRVSSTQPLDVDKTYFDASLKERIKEFQKSNNLRVDGVAGAHTIIRLHNIVDPDVPKLEPAAG